MPAAWSYRKFFETKLPDIFESLNKTRHSLVDPSLATMAREKISKILKIWNDWSIYDLKYTLGLEAIFAKKPNHFGSSQASKSASDKSDKEGERTSFIKDSTEIAIKLKFVEEKLNDDSTKELEKFCRQNGLSTSGGRKNMIERILILRDYELKNNKDQNSEPGIQFETVEKKKIEITTDLIKDYNKLLGAKQPQNLGLHEIDKMISSGLELLRFIQMRNDKIDEKDANGQPLDDLDFALYELPRDEDLDSIGIQYFND